MKNGEFDVLEEQLIKEIFKLIYDELYRATRSYGPFNSTHEGYAVILEELDEMWDDIKANKFIQAKKEAIQVAAMCVRYMMDVRGE
jgi:hypothetical protein